MRLCQTTEHLHKFLILFCIVYFVDVWLMDVLERSRNRKKNPATCMLEGHQQPDFFHDLRDFVITLGPDAFASHLPMPDWIYC